MDDPLLGSVLARLLERCHDAAPGELSDLIEGAARDLGLARAVVYLADVQQMDLVPLHRQGGTGEALAVDGTLAGWCYRTRSPRLAEDPPHLVLWLPLVDGIERMGVLRLAAPALDPGALERARALASLTALLVVSKTPYSDDLLTAVRTRPMTLQAELAWAFMPPRTLGTAAVTSSAVLEPAYEIGGDAFDHALGERNLHLTLVDAMGHDTASGLCAALALAGCRSTRRTGGSLADIAPVVDEALSRWVPDRLLTAVFADLDPVTGELEWVNCGHPPPLLIRHQHVVAGALARRPHLPLGLGPGQAGPAPPVERFQLEPGDRILIHTDGVTEARSPAGGFFGESRLVDTVVRATAAGEPAPEALRRLLHDILAHSGRLTDDATILLAEWHPSRSPDGRTGGGA
ncbi:PP2C family protein-serine/threonine phosphatase [Streptomyces sp. NPDC096136]|uniref:PP2C family protein-serine/threonine phosphatase n=1 Tax=Streptomyces sp. NPDC096136 TaxID=3366076 RepID=UPI0037FF5A38